MKKIYWILLCSMIILIIGAGCSMSNNYNQLKDGVKLTDIVNAIEENIGVEMPVNVNDTTLTELFHIQKSDAADYAGLFSISSDSADNILVVKAAEGKENVIVRALQQRKQDVVDNFEKNLPNEYNKAKAARIIEKNDYVIYLCVGIMENNSYNKSLDNAENIIDGYFK